MTVAVQMLSAEVLKLRRNRGLLSFACLLTSGVVALYFGYGAIRHASQPSQYGPIGGLGGYSRAVHMLGLYFGALAAILVGTEAGTADLSTGVFRDLVTTGRSRWALYAARVPAAIVVTLVFTLSAFLVSIAATFILAGGQPTPDATLILQSFGWIVLANGVIAAFAVGVGSLTGSRALTLTAVIGLQTIFSQLVLNAPSLGSARDALLSASLGQLMPVSGGIPFVMGTGVTVIVLAVWAVVPTAVGVWRTRTRDA